MFITVKVFGILNLMSFKCHYFIKFYFGNLLFGDYSTTTKTSFGYSCLQLSDSFLLSSKDRVFWKLRVVFIKLENLIIYDYYIHLINSLHYSFNTSSTTPKQSLISPFSFTVASYPNSYS